MVHVLAMALVRDLGNCSVGKGMYFLSYSLLGMLHKVFEELEVK